MRSRTIGVLGGIALWLGAALAAEAQVSVTPSGPTALHVTDTTTQYTATVTTNYNFTFYLYVYNNGNTVYFGTWYIFQSGPSYPFQSPLLNTSTWGLAVGNDVNFRGRAMLSARVGTQVDWHVTVTNSTSMGPGAGQNGAFAALALPPDRRTLGLGLLDLEDRNEA